MKLFKNYLLILFVSFFVAVSGANALEFSADMYTKYGTQVNQQAKIYIKGDNSKIELPGMPQYFITKGNKSYVIMTNSKQYMEQQITRESTPQLGYDYKANNTQKKYLGTEFVNGVKAKKYEILGYSGEKVLVWLLKDMIPVRVMPQNSPVVMDFKNIKYSVSNNEFNLPSGYQPISMQQMMGNYSQQNFQQFGQQMQQQHNVSPQQYRQPVQYQKSTQQQYDEGLSKVDQGTNNVDKGVSRVDKVIDTAGKVKSLFGF